VSDDLLQRAEQALEAGNFQQAADLLQDAGDDPEALLLRGRALQELSRHSEAARSFAAAESAGDPGQQARARAGRGFALLGRGDAEQARQAFETALALDPDKLDARRGLGLSLLRAGQLGRAETEVNRCLAQAPDDAGAVAAQGLLRLRQGRNDEAERLLQRAVELDPDSPTAWANLGFVHRRAGRAAKAVEALQRAADLRPANPLTRNSLALALREDGQPERALEQLRRAVDLDPDNAGFRDNLSRLLQELGRLDESVEQARLAVERDASNPHALSRLPTLLMVQGRAEEAVAEADKAAKAHPEHPGFQLNLAVALLRNQRPFEAMHAADKAVQLDPRLRDARLCLAQARLMAGRLDKALESALAAHELGRDEKSHFLIGMVQKELGLKKEAAENFRACLEFDPEDHQGAGTFLAAIESEAATQGPSQAYIRNVFNQYAERHDEHMVKDLGYKGPQVIMEALEPHLGGRQGLRVLDAGCGAGLFGALLKPLAAELTGVDLSSGMLRMALQTGRYDRLEEADIRGFLESGRGPFELITAADVLVYMGDLAPLFRAARQAMPSGGLFAFSVERAESGEFEVSSAGRHRHNPDYLRRLAAEHGFEVLEIKDAVLRREAGKDVPSLVAVLRAA
jgi:predicted TPR repeat methyltransferase